MSGLRLPKNKWSDLVCDLATCDLNMNTDVTDWCCDAVKGRQSCFRTCSLEIFAEIKTWSANGYIYIHNICSPIRTMNMQQQQKKRHNLESNNTPKTRFTADNNCMTSTGKSCSVRTASGLKFQFWDCVPTAPSAPSAALSQADPPFYIQSGAPSPPNLPQASASRYGPRSACVE